MNLRDKRKMAKQLIDKMDENQLDAFISRMNDPYGDLIVSEDDTALANYRRQQYEQGKSKLVPAAEVIKGMKKSLRNRKK